MKNILLVITTMVALTTIVLTGMMDVDLFTVKTFVMMFAAMAWVIAFTVANKDRILRINWR